MQKRKMTGAERIKSFLSDLREVLQKHGAELSSGDDGGSYYPSYRLNLSLKGEYDADGNTLKEGVFDYDLGKSLDTDDVLHSIKRIDSL